MFESVLREDTTSLHSAELSGLLVLLSRLSVEADDAELVDRIAVLEQVKAAAAAAQARMTAAFVTSQRSAQQAAGVPAKRWDRGISAQVALARRESPARAARYTGWAQVLVDELPQTFAILQHGETTEWRAMLVARETMWLSRADRATVDTELAGRLPHLGDRDVEAAARKIAYRLDPEGFVARSRAASKDRRVSLRPAPDTMSRLTALLPAAQGVAAYHALVRAAETARAAGDSRSRGQVMADTLVERITGQAAADRVPVSIDLEMTDRTLFGDDGDDGDMNHHDSSSETNASDFDDRNSTGADVDGHWDSGADDVSGEHGEGHAESDGDRDAHGSAARSQDRGFSARTRRAGGGRDEPAHLIGYGPIPAGIARDLARAEGARAWLRRLYVDPTTGDLAAMESRARVFPERIRHAVILRDQLCRTPWCGAPIRHADHARTVADGGQTSLRNGQGLCEACNYAKQAPGWNTDPGPQGTGESVTTTTPTGHSYLSRPPGLPGARPPEAAALASATSLHGAPPYLSTTDDQAA